MTMLWFHRLVAWFHSPAGPTPPPRLEPFDAADLVARHNAERIRHVECGPLRPDAKLMALAAGRASEAAAAGLSAGHLHDGFEMVPGATRTGENAAIGQPDAESVMATWMSSPGHRGNILDADFSAMGAARALSWGGVPYWYAVFTG